MNTIDWEIAAVYLLSKNKKFDEIKSVNVINPHSNPSSYNIFIIYRSNTRTLGAFVLPEDWKQATAEWDKSNIIFNNLPQSEVLLPCPFCGFHPDVNDDDCIYPATRAVYNSETDTMIYPVYELNCYETGGGCGASILGDSPEDCITKWNTRIA